MTVKNSRRDFLKATATVTTAVATASLLPGTLAAKNQTRGFAIILNREDARQMPAQWAATELRDALKSRSVTAEIFASLEQAPVNFDCIVAATAGSSAGKEALAAIGTALPDVPEAVGLARGKIGARRVFLATG